ncbi:Rab-GTPase-TBC domain protein [Gregarina niphandrodes]|uniref:Rab-GTPase-TBC domain protein n=1 Tax=Gregarina niphandrodes TaxID=110365 RepID=A0A023B7R7_GRENI|nr:Rab-GTPase-TBC domain protein [Gregarina niphandrodes]EZG67809.1 Rab-GTPase-TBC domain protein [Gregarina niphandrodes]|eukprot:XP_011130158.1 Rab-GTPase-TBC domain protein [Gregarina niphandrodes]
MTRDKSAHYAESNAFTDCDAAVTAQSIIGVADTTFMADTPLDDEIQALRTKVLTRALEFGHQDLSSQQDDLSNQQDDLSSQQDDLSSQQDDLSSRHEQRLRDWEQLTLYWTRLCWPQCQKGYAKLGARECDMDTDEMKDLKRQIRVDVQRSMQFFDFHYGLPRSAISERQERLEVILRDLFAAHPQNCNTLNGCREDQVYRVTETDEQCMPNQPPPDDPSSDLTSHSTSHSTSGIDPPSGRSEDSGETESYELQYIQGAHEVCVVFCELNSANVFDSPRFMDFLVNFYLTRLFNLQSRIRFDIGMYQTMAFISELLYRFNPELLKSLILNRHERYRAGWMGDGSELHFTIPWLVTMFAHSIRSFDLLQTIWDVSDVHRVVSDVHRVVMERIVVRG